MGIVRSNRANAHRPTNQYQWITMVKFQLVEAKPKPRSSSPPSLHLLECRNKEIDQGPIHHKRVYDDDAKRTMYHSMGMIMSYSVIITIQDADVILKRVENFVCGTLCRCLNHVFFFFPCTEPTHA